MLFTCIGVCSTHNNVFGIWTPLLGFILGEPLEAHLRRALLLSRGSFKVFMECPISATALAASTAVLVWSLRAFLKGRRRSGGAPLPA